MYGWLYKALAIYVLHIKQSQRCHKAECRAQIIKQSCKACRASK